MDLELPSDDSNNLSLLRLPCPAGNNSSICDSFRLPGFVALSLQAACSETQTHGMVCGRADLWSIQNLVQGLKGRPLDSKTFNLFGVEPGGVCLFQFDFSIAFRFLPSDAPLKKFLQDCVDSESNLCVSQQRTRGISDPQPHMDKEHDNVLSQDNLSNPEFASPARVCLQYPECCRCLMWYPDPVVS